MASSEHLQASAEADNPLTSRFSQEIERVEHDIDEVNKITTDAIDALEEKKRELRKQSDPNNEAQKMELSVDQIDEVIKQLDREISQTQAYHDQALLELLNKKESLKRRLSSIEKLDLLVNVITYKIFETQHEYRMDMDALHQQRQQLIKRSDLSEDNKALQLAELDRKSADIKNTHEATLASLEGQRSELRRETALKASHLDSSMVALRTQHDNMVADLEAHKQNATPLQVEEYNRRISELHRMFEKDMENLKRLQGDGWKNEDTQEKLSAVLESRGLRVTPSGHFLTFSGRHLTRSEASCLGLLEGINVTSWNSIFSGHSTAEKSEESDSTVTEVTSTASEESRMSLEDIYYLKTTVGKPLALALAEITAKQPKDPIHYLGHWLYKYRYNQEVDVTRKREIEELIEERERLEKEKLHTMLQDEARAAMLDMVIRAEEEAIRRELERIARETSMLETEDEQVQAEAADVMGVYNGPTTGQRST